MGIFIYGMTLEQAQWLLGPTKDNEIIEVPEPHGRLIDANEYLKKVYEDERSDKKGLFCYVTEHLLERVPTVIESEA